MNSNTITAPFNALNLTSNGQALSLRHHPGFDRFVADGDRRLRQPHRVHGTVVRRQHNGSYNFTLVDNIDHPIVQGGNFDNLTFNVVATDSDGDPVSQSFTVGIQDDVPVVTGTVAAQTVGEEGLSFGNHHVNGEAQNASTGDVSLNISWGADQNNPTSGAAVGDRSVTFGSSTLTVLTGLNLTSNGQALSYAITQDATGTLLTATAGSDSHTVFTVQLSDANNGTYNFTLVDNIDHPSVQGGNLDSFAFTVVAIDSDGDSVTQSFSVNVQDDVPVVTAAVSAQTVGEEGLSFGNHHVNGEAQNASTGNISLNISWGADQNNPTSGGGTFDRSVAFASGTTTALSGLHLTSNGQALSYSVSPDGTLLTATAGSDNHTVFTVQLSDTGNGTYNFTLVDNIDHPSAHGARKNLDSFTFNVVATDSDGDTVPQSFSVSVQDDIPLATAVAAQTVGEEGLSFGNHGIIGESQVASTGNVSLNISWGGCGRQQSDRGRRYWRPFGDVRHQHRHRVQRSESDLARSGPELCRQPGCDRRVVDGDRRLRPPHRVHGAAVGRQQRHLQLHAGRPARSPDGGRGQLREPHLQRGGDRFRRRRGQPVLRGQRAGRYPGRRDACGDPGPRGYAGCSAQRRRLRVELARRQLRRRWSVRGGDRGQSGHAAHLQFQQRRSLDIRPQSDRDLAFGVVNGNQLGGGQNAPVVITATNGHPFELNAVDLSGGNTSQIIVSGVDVNGHTWTETVSVANVGILGGATSTHLDFTNDATFAGKELTSVSFSVGTAPAFVNVDNLVLTTGAAPAVPGPVAFTDLTTAINNISAVDNPGKTIDLTHLTSHGQTVLYELLDSATLVGYTGSAPTTTTASNVVFTVVLSQDPTNNPNGGYTFTLDKPLDDLNPTPTSAVNFTFNFTAKDFDGDTANGHFSVNVQDDVPTLVAQTPVSIVDGNFLGITGVDFTTAGSWSAPLGAIDSKGSIEGWTYTASPVGGATQVQLERVDSGYAGSFSTDGSPMVDLEASPGNIQVSQNVTGLTAGEQVLVSFEIGEANFGNAKLNVLWDGQSVGVYNPQNGLMQIETIAVTGNGTGTDTLTFQEIGQAGDNTGTFLTDVSAQQVAGTVFEGGLNDTVTITVPVPNTPFSNNLPDHIIGNTPGAATTASGTLAGLVHFGADGPAMSGANADGFQLVPQTSSDVTTFLQSLHLTSLGSAIDHGTLSPNGDTLTAIAADGHNVFTMTVNGDGTWTFNLTAPLDDSHQGADSITIDFSRLVKAVDFDGDTVNLAAGTFNVAVVDDVPVDTKAADTVGVSEQGLPGVQAMTGFLNIAFGADDGTAEHLAFAPGSNGQLGPTLTSGGVALDYLVTTDGHGDPELVAYKDGDATHTRCRIHDHAVPSGRRERSVLYVRVESAARRARRGRRHDCAQLQHQRDRQRRRQRAAELHRQRDGRRSASDHRVERRQPDHRRNRRHPARHR